MVFWLLTLATAEVAGCELGSGNGVHLCLVMAHSEDGKDAPNDGLGRNPNKSRNPGHHLAAFAQLNRLEYKLFMYSWL